MFLIRHGATQWSASGQHTSTTDIALTSEGHAQLGPLSTALRDALAEQFATAVVFSSPLSRALTTAQIVLGEDREVRVDANLIEFNYGDYEGLTSEEIREWRPEWDIWRDGCPNGESTDDVGRRADTFLAGLGDDPELLVVFSHSHFIRILAARAIGLDARQGQIFTLDTATVSLVADVRGKRVIKIWNVDPASQ
jgi:probable phosphoglycerate mutase